MRQGVKLSRAGRWELRRALRGCTGEFCGVVSSLPLGDGMALSPVDIREKFKCHFALYTTRKINTSQSIINIIMTNKENNVQRV